MKMRGVYREVVPPERLVNTESWGAGWPETINTLLLAEEDGETTITERVLYPSKEARDRALETGMADGVAVSFDRLASYCRRWREPCATSSGRRGVDFHAEDAAGAKVAKRKCRCDLCSRCDLCAKLRSPTHTPSGSDMAPPREPRSSVLKDRRQSCFS